MPEACSEDSRIATVLERMDRGFVGTNVTSRMIALIVLSLNIGGIVAAPVLSTTLFLFQAPAQAQSQEAVGKVAQAITVRIEGATQGSGVLVKRDGNRYTVLTAWHVVSGQRPGEELDIYTADGQRHPVEQGSIKRLGQVDMATVTFISSGFYEPATIGDSKSVGSGSSIYISGYPLPTSAVPSRIWRFLKGDLISNTLTAIPNGYQLLYSNPTLPGMSGGAVLNTQGQLIGIHGQGETDSEMSEQKDVAVKTGTNQGIPIKYALRHAGNRITSHAEGNSHVEPATTSSRLPYATGAEQQNSANAELEMNAIKVTLAEGNYLKADIATEKILLESAKEDAPLTKEGILKLPCNLLIVLDDAWSSASLGKYGLTTQAELLDRGGYAEFELRTSWRKAGFLTPIERSDSIYPNGYFPRKAINGAAVTYLIDRFRSCRQRL